MFLGILDFLKDFFYVNEDSIDDSLIPTFEETLTMIDIAVSRKDDLSRKWDYKTLSQLRDDLIYCIAKILDKTLQSAGELHKDFINKLFNLDLDYGIEFRNFVEPIRRKPQERREYTNIPDEWHRPRREHAIYLNYMDR